MSPYWWRSSAAINAEVSLSEGQSQLKRSRGSEVLMSSYVTCMCKTQRNPCPAYVRFSFTCTAIHAFYVRFLLVMNWRYCAIRMAWQIRPTQISSKKFGKVLFISIQYYKIQFALLLSSKITAAIGQKLFAHFHDKISIRVSKFHLKSPYDQVFRLSGTINGFLSLHGQAEDFP